MIHCEIIRTIFGVDYTAGVLVIDDVEFCYTLEPSARASGVKVNGDTCVPPLACMVTANYSNHFERDMLLIYNKQPEYSIEVDGIVFTGIRPHGGNSVMDTTGCPLVAYQRISNDRIYGTAESDLFDRLKEPALNNEVVWVFTNDP